ncbi:MAG: AcrR family transcriptional regulator [Bradymonadia bacterium]
MTVTLREQKKALTRSALLSIANARFSENGFEETTIEEICEAATVSKRTFFRYFPSKEDLVFPNHGERLARFLSFLEMTKPEGSPFDTLRQATRLFAADYQSNRVHFIRQQRIIQSSNSLIAREHAIDRQWEEAIAAWFEPRLPVPEHQRELTAKVVSGAAIGVIRATMRHWYAKDGDADLESLGMAAIRRLELGFLPE